MKDDGATNDGAAVMAGDATGASDADCPTAVCDDVGAAVRLGASAVDLVGSCDDESAKACTADTALPRPVESDAACNVDSNVCWGSDNTISSIAKTAS